MIRLTPYHHALTAADATSLDLMIAEIGARALKGMPFQGLLENAITIAFSIGRLSAMNEEKTRIEKIREGHHAR